MSDLRDAPRRDDLRPGLARHAPCRAWLRGIAWCLLLLAAVAWGDARPGLARAGGVQPAAPSREAGQAHRLAMGVGSAPEARRAEAPHTAGEVIVRFRAGVSRERIDELLALLHLRIAKSLGSEDTFLLTIMDSTSVEAMAEKLSALPEVAEAGANYLMTPFRPGAQRNRQPVN